VTVAGRHIDKLTPIKDVYTFEEDSQTWKTSNIPPFLKPVVASGGINRWKFDYERSARTNSVEVFQDSQWHTSGPLPFALSAMLCVIINDTC